jgi:Icc-related predicted phosphoesterase
LNLTALFISDFHGSVHVLPPLVKKIEEISHLLIFSGDIVKRYARGNEWLAAQDEGRAPQVTDEIRAENRKMRNSINNFFPFLKHSSSLLL